MNDPYRKEWPSLEDETSYNKIQCLIKHEYKSTLSKIEKLDSLIEKISVSSNLFIPNIVNNENVNIYLSLLKERREQMQYLRIMHAKVNLFKYMENKLFDEHIKSGAEKSRLYNFLEILRNDIYFINLHKTVDDIIVNDI